MCVGWGAIVAQQVLSGRGDDPSDNLPTSGISYLRSSHHRALHGAHTDRQFVQVLCTN